DAVQGARTFPRGTRSRERPRAAVARPAWPPFLVEALKQEMPWSINAGGVGRALDRAQTTRAAGSAGGGPPPPPGPGPPAAPVARMVAIVGIRPILLSQVEEQIVLLQAQGQTLPTDSAGRATLRRQLLGRMVDEELLVQQAERDTTIKVTDQEVQDQVEQTV